MNKLTPGQGWKELEEMWFRKRLIKIFKILFVIVWIFAIVYMMVLTMREKI